MKRHSLSLYYVLHCLLPLFLFTSFSSFGQLAFQEVAVASGCGNSTYGSGTLGGGGLSFFDFDNDGWDDITLSSKEDYPVRFFKNMGGTFTEIFPNIANTYETKTVQWVDFDNDGDYDFFATSNLSHNVLYENTGNFEFIDITENAGLMVANHKTFGASWGDIDKDGHLDLFIASRDNESTTVANILYRNNGDKTFTNITTSAGLPSVNYTSFCAAFFDYDNDGWQDFYVANDRKPENLLYHNEGNNTFSEQGAQSGTGVVMDAMSTTIGDYNQDGWLDIYVTNTIQGNAFFRNNGDGTFTDIAATNGTLMESVAWGAVFLDAENDGDLDLYVSAEFDSNANRLSAAFYKNDGSGSYTIPSGIGFEDDLAQSYGNAIGDINNDGYPEIIVLNYFPYNMYLWENQSNTANNWLKVKLEGVQSNRQGIGSWIEISVNGEKQYNYTLCGEGYLGQNSAYEFFGIGPASQIDYVKVSWLSGAVDFIENPQINSHLLVVEGSSPLSVENSTVETGVQVFPNPSSGMVRYSVANQGTVSAISVTDNTGKLLLTVSEKLEGTLDLTSFPAGVYLVRFTLEDRTIVKKIVLQ